jgi:acetyl esterase/lipase
MVAARADYRVKSRQGVTPKECVQDAKCAVRWLRQNAAKLGIDPDRIAAGGGSAGGHIVACTPLTPGLDEEAEDTAISCKADALVLYNPVLFFGPQIATRVGSDEALAKLLSPTLRLEKGTPPTLLMCGTADFLLTQGNDYLARSKELGNRCEMYLAEGKKHGFYNMPPGDRGRRSASPSSWNRSDILIRVIKPGTSDANDVPRSYGRDMKDSRAYSQSHFNSQSMMITRAAY